MGASISYAGTDVNFYFQNWNTGNNTSGVKQVNTSIKGSGGEIANTLSPRDNKTSNGAVATGAIFTNSSIPGQKIDIAYLFNKTGSTIDFTVGGSATYTGSIINTGITFTGQSPTGNDLLFSPTFTVPNPTVDTTSTIKTTCSAVGTYGGPFTVVATQSPPTTTYYTVQSVAFAGGSLVLRLPGNYANGTISGSFTINPPPGTLVRPTTFVATIVSGSIGGPAEWLSSISATPPYSSITDIAYGDKSTYSFVVGFDTSVYVVRGTISFAAQLYTSATLYIQYGVLSNPGVSLSTGALEYSTNGGGSYTTSFTWNTSTTTSNISATSYVLSLPASSNLNQIIIRIRSQQTITSSLNPTIYDMFIAYT